MKIGRRLAIKVLNASKFALTMGAEGAPLDLDPAHITEALDRSVLAELARVVEVATAALEDYDHAKALEATESFFWTFCDDYLELVKDRAYNRDGAWPEEAAQSARAALALVIDTVVRLLAPFLPFVTEEVWSWYRPGSVHRAAWPAPAELGEAAASGDPAVLRVASAALIVLRRVKSEAKVSPRTPFLAVTVAAAEDALPVLEEVSQDLRAATKVSGGLGLVALTGDEDGPANPWDGMRVQDVELGEAPAKVRRPKEG
jgi:valyl-tRNA synthetase